MERRWLVPAHSPSPLTYVVHSSYYSLNGFLKRKQSKQVLITNLSGKSVEKSEPKMTQCEGKVFVEEVLEELAHPKVGPSPVNKKQSFKVSKLCKGVITGKNRLGTFQATDTNANVSSCNGNNNT
jgi:hypothetical protein